MEVNYYVLGLILLGVIIFLWFYFKRNRKDLESLENTINASEMEPEKHPAEDDNVKE